MASDSFSPELRQLVQEQFASGEYSSKEELLLEAVRLLADRNRGRQALRRDLQVGRQQLDRGEGIELDGDEALEAFLCGIAAEATAELASKRETP